MVSRRSFIKNTGIVLAGGLILPTINSCEEFELSPKLFLNFHVKKGEHYYDGPKLVFTGKDNLQYGVYFPESQIHPPRDDCLDGWSKTFGMSRTATEHHHKNSARFAHRCLDYKLYIGHYTYVNEKRTAGIIQEIEPNSLIDLELEDTGRTYNYYVEGELVHTIKHPKSADIKRVLYPYHGGHCGAYQDTYLKFIKER